MADSNLRAALRAVKADPSKENRQAYRLARSRAGLKALEGHSWKAQRERLFRIFESWAQSGRASEAFGVLAGRFDYGWAEGWAEGSGGDSDEHGILIGDWNTARDRQTGEEIHTPMSWLGAMFERLPSGERPAMEWQDTTSTCGQCNRLIDTEHRSMCDRPDDRYLVTEGDILCRACAESDLRGCVGWNASDRAIERFLESAPGWFRAAWEAKARESRDEDQGFSLEGQDSIPCERCEGTGQDSWRWRKGCEGCHGSGMVDAHEDIRKGR